MLVEQLCVFLENKRGRIFDMTDVLSREGVDLLALSIADTKEFGIARLLTDDNDRARDVLTAAGFTVAVNQLIGVEVADQPGGLSKVLGVLNGADLDIEYMYSFARIEGHKAIMLIKAADTDSALRELKAHNIKLLDKSF